MAKAKRQPISELDLVRADLMDVRREVRGLARTAKEMGVRQLALLVVELDRLTRRARNLGKKAQ